MVKQRVEGDFIKINEWLRPLSWLYGAVVRMRNWCFEVGILKSKSFAIPVISVGNITVGGAGKTPHVEYLIRLLHDRVKVAVLSRGYKRKSHGYVLAQGNTSMPKIGDEPFQMHSKFPDVYVAVCKKRCEGIMRLQEDEETKDVQAILLDDAFQHRYVKPGVNILLVDYHRLIIYDELLPAGRLREPLSGKNRADIVIVTKCPKDLKPMEFRVLTKAMNLYPYQHLYFTTLEYDGVEAMYGEKEKYPLDFLRGKQILLLTGIASPEQIMVDLQSYSSSITTMIFADHHNYKSRDIDAIEQRLEQLGDSSIILTTEKDAARLRSIEELPQKLKDNLYILPIRVKFLLNQEQRFNNRIISYIRKNQKISL